jgi:hypothetical protein
VVILLTILVRREKRGKGSIDEHGIYVSNSDDRPVKRRRPAEASWGLT